MEANGDSKNDWIKLKVGGLMFETTASTLLKEDSMLSKMVTSEIPTSKDEDGCIKIDRPGKQFNRILNYLRSGMFPTFESIEDAEELRNEADYYSIEGLKTRCEKRIDEYEKNRMKREHASTVDKNKTILVRELCFAKQSNAYYSSGWQLTNGRDYNGVDGFRIPCMMDGSISRSYLRMAYPSATGLCIRTSKFEFTVLPVVGESIQIPKAENKKNQIQEHGSDEESESEEEEISYFVLPQKQ